MRQYLNKEFLLSNKQLFIKAAAILLLIAVCFFVFVLGDNEANSNDITVQTEQTAGEENGEETETLEKIIVDVGGAVKVPQVVELTADSRVADAIAAAGGLLETADTAEINQAAFLTDGEKVYIPEKGESPSSNTGLLGMESASSEDLKININTATSEELQTLNGVGPATAEKILDYRSSNGYFKTIEDLKNVDGIGDKTFEKVKEHIKV